MKTNMPSRRRFLKTTALGTSGLLLSCRTGGLFSPSRPVRFGLCADVHKDVMNDADQRLKTFIDKANAEKLDFIVQLGDFCCPVPENQGFLAIFNRFQGPRYHVLGNHDTDGDFTREQTLEFWGSERKYYSFDSGGLHFVVLDGNDKKPENPPPGYPRYVGKEQLEWLEADLEKTELRTFVFSHQSLEQEEGVENGAEVRAALEAANARAGVRKVVACFSGHHHIDYHVEIAGIYYVQINSMSYQWLGGDYRHARFSPEIEKAFPYMSYTAPYRDPLYALVTVDPRGAISIRGVRSQYMPPSPSDLGYPERKDGHKNSASIQDCTLSFV